MFLPFIYAFSQSRHRIVNNIVIADEAHNNSTKLAYEMLQRVNPSCIVEYTATPASNSNILHHVCAMELKVEEMIKLPIILTVHQTWEQSIAGAIQARKGLAELAKNDSSYIRPIMLIQAESKDKDVTVDVIKKYLIEQENIDECKIAIATGDQRELDGINIFDPKCPIEYVITVEALKEGWDCSFAYVFCSVASRHSTKDIEQLLGRVLRMSDRFLISASSCLIDLISFSMFKFVVGFINFYKLMKKIIFVI